MKDATADPGGAHMTDAERDERIVRLESCQERIIQYKVLLDGLQDQLERGIRPRIHNLNDELQQQRMKIQEHSILLGVMQTDIAMIRKDSATREQLEMGLLRVGQEIKDSRAQTDLKLDALKETLDPIKRGIYWVVTLIVGAVILALIGLAMKGGKP